MKLPGTFRREDVARDLGAALVVVVMLVPQSLAYAQLAGMPLATGLYASVLPMVAYALFGSSTTLSVGPVAVISLMTAHALAQVSAGGETYLLLAAWLALLSGAMLMVAGWLRLGFVANLLSHSVVAGFMSGAALLIVLGQIKTLLGMQGAGETAMRLALSLLGHRDSLHVPTAMVGIVAVVLLWSLPQLVGRFGMRRAIAVARLDLVRRMTPVLLVILAILVTAWFDLDVRYAIAVVGPVPGGLPVPGIALPPAEQLAGLLIPALGIALIGFIESVSVAQSLGLRRGERVSPDAELKGLGAANLAAGLSGGFPVAGGLSRSIVNFSAGARTRLAGVYAAVLMLGVVTFLTGAFSRLPNTVLAAAIILPALGLIDLRILREAWKFSRSDAWAYSGTTVGVLTLGIELGILCGVVFSGASILWRAGKPRLIELGRVPGTTHYRGTRVAEVITHPRVMALRLDGELFFANFRPVESMVEAALESRAGVTHLVLDLSSVNQIDLTGLDGLRELNQSLRARGITLHLSELRGLVLDRVRESALPGELSRGLFRFTHDAFVALNATVEEDALASRRARPAVEKAAADTGGST